ncbi:MAG: CoA-binding protein, partial [Anaerolineae bacterium]|nr:CoA-binding protein [Anaerolineae bacterium]
MLKHFFEPESVAIVGASASPDKLGHAVLKNAIEGGYRGRLYPINPKAPEILGLKAYPSVSALPETPDLVVVVIPYQHVAAAIEEAGQKGVRAAVVISAGFREAGLEGMKREIDVVERARKYNMRIVGPNCLGVIDTFTPLNATFAAGTPPSGPIGFMSQSGALGTAILDWAMAGSRIGFSKFVSLGNKADVSEIDLMKAWADDPHTRVILAYIEGLPNGPEFMRVAREVSRKKPIAVVKSGITSAGAKAVSSHTGSLAGSEQAYAAAFKQSGVLRAPTMQDLFDYALGFAYQPLLPGDRIAIVTNAGGPGILCTDALEHAGMPMARLSPETTAALKAGLPEAASSGNPVDVLGDAMADRYLFALETVAADPNVDGLVVIVTPQAMTEIDATARAIGEAARKSAASERPIPVMSCIMGEWRVNEAVEMLAREYGVPNYPFPERAAAALAAMRDYRRLQAKPEPVIERFEVDNDRVRQVFRKAREEGRVAV